MSVSGGALNWTTFYFMILIQETDIVVSQVSALKSKSQSNV